MKKYLYILIAAVLTGCSSNNYDGLLVFNLSNTGCNQATRSEGDLVSHGDSTWGIRCQAKTTRQSYWHELRDHQKYCPKNDIKTGTHTQVPMTQL